MNLISAANLNKFVILNVCVWMNPTLEAFGRVIEPKLEPLILMSFMGIEERPIY